MNAERRKKIQSAIDLLSEARDEEQNAVDSLPESLTYSEKGETMQENADRLQESIDALEGIDGIVGA